MRARFPIQARLTRARDFEAVYQSGVRIQIPPLRARVLCRPDGGPAEASRLGLSVAGRVGRAVRRNRWKRAIREAFRLHRHKLPAAYDIVISVEWNSSEVHMGRVEESFLAIVEALRRNERHRSAPGQQG